MINNKDHLVGQLTNLTVTVKVLPDDFYKVARGADVQTLDKGPTRLVVWLGPQDPDESACCVGSEGQ